MKILAIDTAERTCSIALAEDRMLMAEMMLVSKQTHSKHLMDMIDAVLRYSDIKISDIDAFAVGKGPGSFTGLRIGISVIKGLALGADKPLLGVSNLDALAVQCSLSSLPICVMTDARKSEVYICRYRINAGKLCRKTEPQALSPDNAISDITEPHLFVGSGALLYQDIIRKQLGDLAQFAPNDAHLIKASTLARLASERLDRGESDDPADLVPHYIRKADVKPMREQ